MNATELCFDNGAKAGVWYCRQCGIPRRDVATAEECCKPYICECGKELPRKEHRTRCADCTRRQFAERNAKRLAEATLVDDYDGWICSEEVSGDQDGYFESVEDLLEYCVGYDVEVPEFAFCCTRKPFAIDARRVIEFVEVGMDLEMSDWEPSYAGREEFDAACKRFSELNVDVCTWSVDYTRKVRVRELDTPT